MNLLFIEHIAALIPGLKNPMVLGRCFRRLEWFVQRQCCGQVFSLVFVFLFSITLRLAIVPIVPPGIPAIHDEYCYLLQGDTFAGGRLTNPAHPMWEHFDTYHVLQHPTYASKFFPGQGLFLALGQYLFGDPWVGVLLSIGFMCMAMTWCVQGCMGTGWALFAGLVMALQFGTTHYFASSYWGGAVQAIGGCLAFGGAVRLMREPRMRDGLWFGIGALILSATRPYEGGVLCAGLLVWLGFAMCRRFGWRHFMMDMVGPAGLVLCLGGAWLLYYFYVVTGDALTPPYMVWAKTYSDGVGLSFTDNHHQTRPFLHEIMRQYYEGWARPIIDAQSTFRGVVASVPYRVEAFLNIVTPIYFVPMLLSPLAMVNLRQLRPILALIGLTILAFFGEPGSSVHYLAPGFGVYTVSWLMTLRWMRCLRVAGRPFGLSYVRMLPFILLAFTTIAVVRYPDRLQSVMQIFGNVRHDLEKKLLEIPGDDLVVVRYSPDHNVHAEWVYNAADIDHAPIVWARDMGAKKNAELFAYFKNRKHWCADVGSTSVQFGPCEDQNMVGDPGSK